MIDDEIAGRIARYRRGISIDQNKLAFDVIARVGPEGSYLLDEHTVRHMRDEFWISPLSNRQNPASWLGAGARDVLEMASDQVNDILSQPAEPVLPASCVEEIQRVLREADRALARS